MERKETGAEKGVEKFFGSRAEGYARSRSHAAGADLSMLVSHLSADGSRTALDVATGTGFTAMELAKKLKYVCAIDRTKEMLRQAMQISGQRNIANIHYISADASRIPFGSGTFDIVTCRRAAHHFRAKEEFLKEAGRVLKEHGELGIADMVSPAGTEGEFNAFETARDSSHAYAENEEEWKRLILEAGFSLKFLNVLEERISFEKWLYPVTLSEEGGKRAGLFIRNSSGEFRRSISYDSADGSFLKRRLVLVAEKCGKL